MEAKALAPEPISSYSVLLSPCLPSLFAAHLRQIHPFVCQAMCFESFSACYWFSSPRLFLHFIFSSASNIDLNFPHLLSLLSVSLTLLLFLVCIKHLLLVCAHFFSLYHSLFLTLSISRLCFFFFFCEWKVLWLEVYSVKTLLSVCLHVCVLGKRHAFNFVAVFHMTKC